MDKNEKPKVYPKPFLFGLAGNLRKELNQLFAAYQVPAEAMQALSAAAFLDTLAYQDPGEYLPGGFEGWQGDVAEAVKDAAWLYGKVTELRAAKIQAITKDEYRAAQELLGSYPIYDGLG